LKTHLGNVGISMAVLKALAIGFLWWAVGRATAGEFVVQPMRLDLGPAARSSAISVRNDSKEPLSFQIQGMEWTQDGNGKDRYTETTDLVFFPKIITVEPEQQGVIRVGIKNSTVPLEKTFRLFIEELPSNIKKPEGNTAQITFLMRIGAPIFVAPVRPQDGLEIETLALVKGTVSLSTRNTGNRHQIIQGIHLKGSDSTGKEVYAVTLADRYLLSGSAKSHTATIAAELCSKISSLAVEFQTDKLTAKRALSVDRNMCS
jgi:fimbrial chaperone protein